MLLVTALKLCAVPAAENPTIHGMMRAMCLWLDAASNFLHHHALLVTYVARFENSFHFVGVQLVEMQNSGAGDDVSLFGYVQLKGAL